MRKLLFIPLLFLLLFPAISLAAVMATDTFTEASDTALDAHTKDTGGSWVADTQALDLDVEAATDTLVLTTGSGLSVSVIDDANSETDYFTEIEAVTGGTGASDRIGSAVRCDATPNYTSGDCYIFRIRGSDGWTLLRLDSGSFNSLDSDTGFNTANGVNGSTVIKLKLQVEGTGATVTLNAWIELDGGGYSQVVTNLSDSSANRIVTAGKPGVHIGSTQNPAITWFNAEDLTSGGTIAPLAYEYYQQGN